MSVATGPELAEKVTDVEAEAIDFVVAAEYQQVQAVAVGLPSQKHLVSLGGLVVQ